MPGGAEAAPCLHVVHVSEQLFCQFLEEDLKIPLPRKVILDSQERVRELARRGGAAMNLDVLQALDHGIEIGEAGYGWNSRTSNIRSSGFGEASVGTSCYLSHRS
jgi:hypothetical protein